MFSARVAVKLPGCYLQPQGNGGLWFLQTCCPLGQGEWRPFVSTNTSTCSQQTCNVLGADVALDLVVSPLAKAVDNDDVLRALERPVFIAVFNYLAGKARPNSWQQRQVLGARGIQINARSIAIRRRTALMISVCNAGTIGRSSCALILAERPVTGARRARNANHQGQGGNSGYKGPFHYEIVPSIAKSC